MYGLLTMHRMNNPQMYELTEEEKRNIRRYPTYAGSMSYELAPQYRPGTRPVWEEVRLKKAFALRDQMQAELDARLRPVLRLVK